MENTYNKVMEITRNERFVNSSIIEELRELEGVVAENCGISGTGKGTLWSILDEDYAEICELVEIPEIEINIEGIIERLQEIGSCHFPDGEVPEILDALEGLGYICSFNQSDDKIVLEERIENTILVNCTPHAVNILEEGTKNVLTIQPSGICPRCEEVKEVQEKIRNGFYIKINKKSFGEVIGLPETKENTLYIVSTLVASAAKDRVDLVVPDDIVRNEKGQIIGCRALARI